MVDIQHKNITGADAAHPPAYPSESDPTTTLGAHRWWIKPSTGVVKRRNAANTAWDDISIEGTSAGSAPSLADLSDVDVITVPPGDGEALVWDDTAGEWVAGSVAAGSVDATDVSYAGGTGMSATNVETAIDELATEKANDSALTAHIDDTADAHDATAISYAGGTGMSATQVEAAIDELATEKANASDLTAHTGDTSDAHDASAISILDAAAQYTATEVEGALAEVLDGLQVHEADTTDAHDASAISFSPAGSIAATNVQAAIEEAASEAGGGGSAHVIQDEGTPLTQRANLSFEGAGVTVTDDSGDAQTVVTISGGGSANDTRTILASDVATSSTTIVDVTGLSFSVTSGVTYHFRAFMLYTTSNITNGSGWGLNGPTATNLAWRLRAPGTTATSENLGYIGNVYGVVGGNTSLSPGTNNVAEVEGMIKPSASGTVVIRFSSEVGSETITVKAGSYIEHAAVA